MQPRQSEGWRKQGKAGESEGAREGARGRHREWAGKTAACIIRRGVACGMCLAGEKCESLLRWRKVGGSWQGQLSRVPSLSLSLSHLPPPPPSLPPPPPTSDPSPNMIPPAIRSDPACPLPVSRILFTAQAPTPFPSLPPPYPPPSPSLRTLRKMPPVTP
jgi:hypothetical protein